MIRLLTDEDLARFHAEEAAVIVKLVRFGVPYFEARDMSNIRRKALLAEIDRTEAKPETSPARENTVVSAPIRVHVDDGAIAAAVSRRFLDARPPTDGVGRIAFATD